jgi:hypothetical protein
MGLKDNDGIAVGSDGDVVDEELKSRFRAKRVLALRSGLDPSASGRYKPLDHALLASFDRY